MHILKPVAAYLWFLPYSLLVVRWILDLAQKQKMMQYEEEGEKLADKSACAGVRADLKMCLLNSDCVKKDKKTPRECLRSNDPSVPLECYALRTTFFECKRSMLDNRQRFRGRKGY